MPRPIRARISPAHLSHNLGALRARLAPGSELMAVIKANAYGHGIERIYPGLAQADSLAMLDLDEACRVRALGWSGPVLLIEGAFTLDDYSLVQQLGLDFTLHNPQQLTDLQRFLERAVQSGAVSSSTCGSGAGSSSDSGAGSASVSTSVSTSVAASVHGLERSRVFVKVNTGMNRLGYMPDEALTVMLKVMQWRSQGKLGPLVLMTHFANADEAKPAGPDAATQAARLTALAHTIRQQADAAGLAGVGFSLSLGNSAAALGHVGLAGSIVRTGIAAWGASTGPVDADSAGLKPVMRLSSRIIGVQHLQPGDRVGYGSRFAAQTAMRIGVVACGYADGYPRHAPDGTPVVVQGVRTRLVGRVSMDMLTVDITHLPTAGLGSEVVLFGDDGLGVDEVATACGTIGYELLCAVASRVPFEVDAAGLV